MKPSARWYRSINALGALLFALFALVQLNDPDPLGWVALYGAISVACAAASTGRLPAVVAVAGAALLAVGAAFITGTASGQFNPMPGFSQDSWLADEEVREALGLVLAAAWLFADYVALKLWLPGEDPLAPPRAEPGRQSD